MRLKVLFVILAGVLLALPAHAQTTTTTTTTTQTQDPTLPPPPPPAMAPETDRDLNSLPNEFIVAGFVGGSFARSAVQTSVDFGAALDYLHNGAFGIEGLVGFAPRFKLDRLGGTNSDLNNYMANVIASVPVGAFHAVRPFVSAGVGALTISQGTNTSNNGVVNTTAALFSPSETHFGGNIGGGIMAFTGAYGIRADVRYFSALGHKNTSGALLAPGTASPLDDASFWRANIGFAFRF